MNISKNQWIVIGIVGAVAIWYFLLRKKDNESGYESGGGSSTCDCCNNSSLSCASGYCGICCESHGGTKAAGCGGSSVRKRSAKTITNESGYRTGGPTTPAPKPKSCGCMPDGAVSSPSCCQRT